MNTTINIQLNESNLKQLNWMKTLKKSSAEDIVNKALDDYFFFENLTQIREELSSIASDAGINSEKDFLSEK